MAEAALIPQRLAELLRLCLDLEATYVSSQDMQFEPVTDFLPEGGRELIEDSLLEYCPILIYSAPRKQEGDPLHLLIVGKRDDQWHALTFGLPKGNYDVCMTLLREAADERRAPFPFWVVGNRGWAIAAIIISVINVGLGVYLATRMGMSADAFRLIAAQMATGAALSITPLVLGRTLWNNRARRIHELRDAIPA